MKRISWTNYPESVAMLQLGRNKKKILSVGVSRGSTRSGAFRKVLWPRIRLAVDWRSAPCRVWTQILVACLETPLPAIASINAVSWTNFGLSRTTP